MNRPTLIVVFEDQHARTFDVGGILLDQNSGRDATDRVTNPYVVGHQLFGTMHGHKDVAPRDQGLYSLK
jgi:hypothetical protein